MKIVVVDHVYLEPEHVAKLRSLGDLKVFGEPPKTESELKDDRHGSIDESNCYDIDLPLFHHNWQCNP